MGKGRTGKNNAVSKPGKSVQAQRQPDFASAPRAAIKRGQFSVRTEMSMHVGPLPSPAILEGYEKVVPGAGNRIFAKMEQQSDHRMRLEDKVTDAGIRGEFLGQIISGITVVLALVLGAILILYDKNIAGYLAMFGPLGGLAAMFLYKKAQGAGELKEKRKTIENSMKLPQKPEPSDKQLNN